MSNLDPSDVPAVVEIFSHSSSAWFVGLVVKNANGYLTIRFIDNEGERKEKLVSCEGSDVAYFGSHLGWISPPGVVAVPSASRAGEVSYLDASLRQKFASPELAWQAFLEHQLDKAPSCARSPEGPLSSSPASGDSRLLSMDGRLSIDGRLPLEGRSDSRLPMDGRLSVGGRLSDGRSSVDSRSPMDGRFPDGRCFADSLPKEGRLFVNDRLPTDGRSQRDGRLADCRSLDSRLALDDGRGSEGRFPLDRRMPSDRYSVDGYLSLDGRQLPAAAPGLEGLDEELARARQAAIQRVRMRRGAAAAFLQKC
ncbi:unnamed protein product [Effrenium voratum]|nr:unnamed protein product [Effrenium voratum]